MEQTTTFPTVPQTVSSRLLNRYRETGTQVELVRLNSTAKLSSVGRDTVRRGGYTNNSSTGLIDWTMEKRKGIAVKTPMAAKRTSTTKLPSRERLSLLRV